MEFIRELMIIEAEKAKKKVKKPACVSGNMVMSKDEPAGPGEEELSVTESKNIIKVDTPKPRNKQLSTVLATRKSGRHHDAKKDYVRAKEKQKNRECDALAGGRDDSDFL